MLLATLRILLERREIDDRTLSRLLEHRDAIVRLEAIKALKSRAKSFTQDEVKDILLKKDQSDRAGQAHFDTYVYDDLMDLTESQLSAIVDKSKIYDDAAYFARAEKFFKKYRDNLRQDIDDSFQTYFRERVARMRSSFPQAVRTDRLLSKCLTTSKMTTESDLQGLLSISYVRRANGLIWNA